MPILSVSSIKTSNLPELQCAIKNVAEPNCYDKQKLLAFRSILLGDKDNEFLTDHYYQVFDYSRIELQIIYPYNENILLYDRERGDGGSIVTLMPISIYDPISKKSDFGYHNVTYYGRNKLGKILVPPPEEIIEHITYSNNYIGHL